MQRVFVFLIATLWATASWSADRLVKLPPPFPWSHGFLSSFIYTAEAYRAECARHVSPKELNETVGAWFQRNEALAAKVFEAGRTAKWYSPNQSSEQVWDQMRRNDAARLRSQVASLIQPSPKLMCTDGLRNFKDGSTELENFPVQLKAIGISLD